MEQRTFEWFAARLGCFTGSEVGKLMVKSKKKNEIFGETAKSYIMKKLAERHLIDEVRTDEEVFNEYQYITSISSKAMKFGEETEPLARKLVMKETGEIFLETGSIPHPNIGWFSSSPDGVTNDNSLVLEIKCPCIETCIEYRCTVHSADDLKQYNSIYYWQCIAHMAVTGAKACIFAVFNPFLKEPLHYIRIERDEEAIGELELRVIEANDYITSLESLHFNK